MYRRHIWLRPNLKVSQGRVNWFNYWWFPQRSLWEIPYTRTESNVGVVKHFSAECQEVTPLSPTTYWLTGALCYEDINWSNILLWNKILLEEIWQNIFFLSENMQFLKTAPTGMPSNFNKYRNATFAPCWNLWSH